MYMKIISDYPPEHHLHPPPPPPHPTLKYLKKARIQNIIHIEDTAVTLRCL